MGSRLPRTGCPGLAGHLAVATALASAILAAEASGFSPERVGFRLSFRDEVSSYRTLAVFVVPGEALALKVSDGTGRRGYLFTHSAGTATPTGTNRWRWEAPAQAGVYPAVVSHPEIPDTMTLHLFVMVPYSALEGEYLNGYRIGRYPTIPFRNLTIYKPPRGFIEVTEDNEQTPVSPHFTLKQFVSKQEGGYPKYVVLRERLLLKLEMILEKANERGHRCETLHIMSGYRTPFYNDLIGNVRYSRHIYGGAADIFIDENPVDGMMDDLNRDGRSDYLDAAVLYDMIDDMYGSTSYELFHGGLARYRKTSSHGPFVHVDVRGFPTRWGD